ncbi:glycosyltransferase family 4 protein [Cerasibacillus terrae]|uniref:Glycosyltransferase family 4 protein n=1 Tax=Cerasibacillus terrae TaxID=2498845 RepID=A0A5C8NZM2_9BACI|nr:glycosyltransferase family 4 protein [Cerasibacillus terrae]TXL66769.1 glycosyltransferase family 4 protein [Cerasibacillus terrae]
MNILFLTMVNINSINRQNIYSDLMRKFRERNHNVYIVSPREKKANMPTEFNEKDGIHFLKVKIGNITKTNVIEKGISTIRIESLFLKAIKKYMNDIKFDLALYSTPPITFEKVISYIKKRDGAKSYLLLKDIFPQNAVDLNMFSKKGIIYKYFRLKEKKLYAQSDFIGCMSKANVDFVLKNNPDIPPDTVEVCPNSIEPQIINNNKTKMENIRKKYNIPLDKTVFIYGGNLGKPQGIDFLIKCLNANQSNKQVYFVIAGSGTEFNKLQSFFNKEKVTNAQLFNQLPKEDYEILANSCDVGLIFLDNRFTIPNFPSRLLTYMQASMPVLAATDVNTDIGQVIEQGKFGLWCESNNVEEFNKQVQRLCDENLRKQMGINSRKYLEKNYTSRHSYEIIMSHFR